MAGVSMLRIIRFVVVMIVVISGLAVHLRNDQPVVFDYYLGNFELPFSLFLIVALCCGVLIGIVTLFPLIVRLKNENNRLISRARLSEKELDNLRVIPMKNTY